MAAVGPKGSLVLAAVFYMIWAVNGAPVDEVSSQALQMSESTADPRGCYYNFEHYGEGDRILTNEPCLNCTCHNRMLMCYLRVCPFTKAIGQNCTVEKIPDQCCPVITCPQVPVALLTSSTTSESPLTTTDLRRPDNYGCILEDNTFYADGAQVPSDPRKPCELCYCIRNHTACVMQECTLNVEGCKPVYQEGVCCPVRYDCDYDDVATTPKPTIGLVTTPGGPSDCLHNGVVYHDGAMVMKDEKAPCEHCYCMRGDIVCAVQECGKPLEGTDCTPMEPKHGQCCPNYKCANGTQSYGENDLSTSTEKPSQTSSESYESEKHENEEESSDESSSNESSEESKEETTSDASKPLEDEVNSNAEEAPSSTSAPEHISTSEEPSVSEHQPTKLPETTEIVTTEMPLQENNHVHQTGDSISEATQDLDVTHVHKIPQIQDISIVHEIEDHEKPQEANQEQEVIYEQEIFHEPDVIQEQPTTPKPEEESTQKQEITHEQEVTNLKDGSLEHESQTKAPIDVVKDTQVTNEIPESTPPEQPEITTAEPTPEVARVPGEGSCLVEGKTYPHNSNIPTENPCQESCKCYSSIVSCKPKDCPPPPTQFEHCMPVTEPGSCCPTYMCDQKPSAAPEAQNQLVDKTDDENPAHSQDQNTEIAPTPEKEDKDNIVSPIVEGIPPHNLLPGSYENELPTTAQTDKTYHEPDQTTELAGVLDSASSSSIDEDKNVNSHIVHGMVAAIDGGQVESMDSTHNNVNPSYPSDEMTTMEPDNAIKSDNESVEKEPEINTSNINDENPLQPDVTVEHTTSPQLEDELLQTTIFETTSKTPGEDGVNDPKETSTIETVKVEPEDSITPETTSSYVSDVTTERQDVIHENNVPSVDTTEPQDINVFDGTSDSNLDESNLNENIVTSVPVGEITTQKAEHDYTEKVLIEQEEIPIDEIHTVMDEEHTISPTQHADKIHEVSNETAASNDEKSPDASSETPDDTNNLATEENISSETVPIKEDFTTEANQVSSSSEETATHFAGIIDENENEVPTSTSPDKSTESPIIQSSEGSSGKIPQGLDETTDSAIQTTVRYETFPTITDVSQDENEGQESNNVITSSPETATSEGSTTTSPVSHQENETGHYGEPAENNTINEVTVPTEGTPEGPGHSTPLATNADSPVSASSIPSEENVTHKTSLPEEVGEHELAESDKDEVSTESKPIESIPQEPPKEIETTTISQSENENSQQNNILEDSLPGVIFEAVTSAGMPSIESHVTEGSLDHSVHHINNLSGSDNSHTAEHSEPEKENSGVNEVQSSAQPSNTEVPIDSTHITEKTIEIQGMETTQRAEIPSNEAFSIPHETSTEALLNELIHTTPKPTSDDLTHQNIPIEEETAQDEKEVNSGGFQETTVAPETNNEVSSENIDYTQEPSSSATEKNYSIDTDQSEIHSQPPQDEKNEVTLPVEESSNTHIEDSQAASTNQFSTESVNELSGGETTVASQTDSHSSESHPQPNNEEVNSVAESQTDAPSHEHKTNLNHDESTPSPDLPETEDGSHKPQANENEATSTEGSVTHPPETAEYDQSQDTSHIETTQGPTHSESTIDTSHSEAVYPTQHSEAPQEIAHTDAPEGIPQTDSTQSWTETSHTEQSENTAHSETAHETYTDEPVDIPQTETPSDTFHSETSHGTYHTETPVNIPHSELAQDTSSTELIQDLPSTQAPQEISQTELPIKITPSQPTNDISHEEAPLDAAHAETAHDTTHLEQPDEPSYIPPQEPTQTSLEQHSDNIPEDSSSAPETTDQDKEISTEVTKDVTQQPSTESPEVSLSDTKDNLHEGVTESDTEHSSNIHPANTDSGSSATVAESEKTEPPVLNTSEVTTFSPNIDEDPSPPISQVTHLENDAPPAPDSDSHILETSDTEEDTSTKATEQSTIKDEVSDNQQTTVDVKPPNEDVNRDETEQSQTDKPLTEGDSDVPATVSPDITDFSPAVTEHESSSMHPEIQMNITTQRPVPESVSSYSTQSSELQPSIADTQTTTTEAIPITQKIEVTEHTQKPEEHVPVAETSTSIPEVPEQPQEHLNVVDQPTDQSSKVPTVSHSTEIVTETPSSSTHKPLPTHHEEGPSFPTWSQKPFEPHTTPEPHTPEEGHYPSGFDPEYEDEEGVSYGPGTCRYGGKVYLSAQQIPRDDPCDFCFCFRSDIICLQQSCPPPIRGCYQETIKGFCCPRYECHVSMATMMNLTTTTTTTTTTLPPHFFPHAYNGAATKAGCQVKDVAYSVGERIPSTSGPCLECRCGANGQMKCDPTVCGPQEALLRQVMDAAVSRRR